MPLDHINQRFFCLAKYIYNSKDFIYLRSDQMLNRKKVKEDSTKKNLIKHIFL